MPDGGLHVGPAVWDHFKALAAIATKEEIEAIIREEFSLEEQLDLLYNWKLWARETQLAPEKSQAGKKWTSWLILAGRGFGKTRTGAEWIIERQKSGTGKRMALVGETAADVRDVMVEGESGILACAPPWNMPNYTPSKRRLEWPNGSIATTYSAEEPDQLRGPAHDTAWCDEIAKWRYPDTWDQLMFGLRLGTDPRVCATTTPRPIKLIRELLKDTHTAITRGSSYDNRANLAKTFFRQVISKYEGTRLGRQELNAEVLDDVPGALFVRDIIDLLRRKPGQIATDNEVKGLGSDRAVAMHMRRITINIDPAATSGEEADETGLTVTGLGEDGHGYVLADESGRYKPNEWGEKAIALYNRFDADVIVAEVNNGGEMVENTLRAIDLNVSYKAVHASKGKVTRAEPVSALYEQKKIHHVGSFPALEDQMCMFTSDFDRKKAGFSPDRMDSMVWGFTELMLEEKDMGIMEFYKGEAARMREEAKEPEKVVMTAPRGVSTVYLSDGSRAEVIKGKVTVAAEEVSSLRRAGFKTEEK